MSTTQDTKGTERRESHKKNDNIFIFFFSPEFSIERCWIIEKKFIFFYYYFVCAFFVWFFSANLALFPCLSRNGKKKERLCRVVDKNCFLLHSLTINWHHFYCFFFVSCTKTQYYWNDHSPSVTLDDDYFFAQDKPKRNN